MKFTKFVGCAALAMAASCAFADAANVLIMFSTPGPDKYADGATVLDGERYALVWSADGNFDGIKTDGTAVDNKDLVIDFAYAKNGRCPFTVYQIDSMSQNAKRTGVYGVYLLDTRTADKKSVVVTAANGLPEVVNGAISAQDYTAAAAMASTEKKASAGEKAWGETEVVAIADAKPLNIKDFKLIGNAKVELKVEGMLPGVRYNVKMGKKPNKLETYALEVPATTVAGEDATFTINKKNAQFFQVVREPLKK